MRINSEYQMQPSTTLESHLDQLIERYQTDVSPLLTEHVSEWDSPIYQQPAEHEQIHWIPCRQDPPLQFDQLEAALEIRFLESIKTFFGRWYAGDLAVNFQTANDGEQKSHPISLLQVQAVEDGDRLLENFTGHILMKRKLKQPETLFIGLAEEADDLLLTVDNETGAVGLEWIGQPQHQVLADSLAEFLQCCSPNSGKSD